MTNKNRIIIFYRFPSYDYLLLNKLLIKQQQQNKNSTKHLPSLSIIYHTGKQEVCNWLCSADGGCHQFSDRCFTGDGFLFLLTSYFSLWTVPGEFNCWCRHSLGSSHRFSRNSFSFKHAFYLWHSLHTHNYVNIILTNHNLTPNFDPPYCSTLSLE